MANDVNPKWHALKTNELMRALQTSRRGLSEEEAERRLKEFGPNELREKKRTSALNIFIGQFKSIFVIMLILSYIISKVDRA